MFLIEIYNTSWRKKKKINPHILIHTPRILPLELLIKSSRIEKSFSLLFCVFHCPRSPNSWCASIKHSNVASLHVHLASNWYNYCFRQFFFAFILLSLVVHFHSRLQVVGFSIDTLRGRGKNQLKTHCVRLPDEWILWLCYFICSFQL